MNRNEYNENMYNEDMTDFLDRILEPMICLSRVFTFGSEGNTSQPRSEHYDVGNVTFALASLAKLQLQDLALQLIGRYGELNVVLSRDEHIPTSIVDILPKNKD